MTASEIPSVIKSLQRDGKLPANLTQGTVDEMTKSLTRYFGQVGDKKIAEFTERARQVAEDALRTEEAARAKGDEVERSAIRVPGATDTYLAGGTRTTGRNILTQFIEDTAVGNVAETMNMDFFLRIASEVASGAGQFLAQNYDQTRLDEFPALELHRVYEREVPRGSEKDPAGPENAWDDDDGRWVAACDEAGDEDAAQVFEDTGRMVALKSSGVWQALGDGAGGYDDTLGNPFAPFAFNSGYDTDEVSRADAVELGLMEDDDDAEPAPGDFKEMLRLE